MKLIEKINRLFKKPEPKFVEPVVIKTNTIPTNLYKGKVFVPKEDFVVCSEDEIEKYVKRNLIRQIEEVIEKNMCINVQENFYTYIDTTEVFIGFESEVNNADSN